MPACPACGTANDTRAKRCSQCGTALITTPFEQAVPATRRMGHTMLGVSPLKPPSHETATNNDPAGNQAALQPFAPVPGTLRGLSLQEIQDQEQQVMPLEEDNSGTGLVPPPRTLPFGRSQTLTGFGAPPEGNAVSADLANVSNPPIVGPSQTDTEASGVHEPTAERYAPDAPVAPTATPLPKLPDVAIANNATALRPKATTHHATMVGLPPMQTEPAHGKVERPAAPLHATLVGFAAMTDIRASHPRPEAPTPPAGAGATKDAQTPPTRHDAPFKGTLMGVSPVTDPRMSVEEPRKASFRGTLLGVAPVIDSNARLAVDPAPLGAGESNANPERPGQQRHEATYDGTAPGMAPPTARVHVNPEPAPLGQLPDHKGTLLGVAIPGIAPLQPGQDKPAVRGGATGSSMPRTGNIASEFSTVEQADSPNTERKRQRRSLTWIFGSAAAALTILGLVALAFWWTSVRLKVEVQSGESGGERLALTCANCPDGTTVSMEEKSTTFRTNRASMDLSRRLAIGRNQLTLHVRRPNRPRGEMVNVTVPVDFRASVSLVDLAANPPRLSVDLETTPGTQFTVEGKLYAVDASGKLKVPVDVAAALSGPASTVVPLERRIAYEVNREGTVTRGTLVVRSGITPLEVTTPGPFHITQQPTFTLSGKTSPQAKLLANGHNIAVASNGTFHQEMALSAPGATTLAVRAQEPNQAPRIVEVSLERVTNLRQRALELSQSLPNDFDSIKEAAETSPDSMVALHAEVVAIEAMGALTRIVGSSNCRQRPCLSSIRYGGVLTLRPGDQFMALGRAKVSVRVNSNDRDLSLEAGLVVEESRR